MEILWEQMTELHSERMKELMKELHLEQVKELPKEQMKEILKVRTTDIHLARLKERRSARRTAPAWERACTLPPTWHLLRRRCRRGNPSMLSNRLCSTDHHRIGLCMCS